ncbi:hypothetical protein [Pseudoruegeria sp. HB172150]|uniref:hypothetical protein n=1 Tax=Pseudoruegeria sp. HB172150 TaxID=2721164 RepID=UPI001553E4FA|nr:hypothetical protein [Pseudoruegeria sp. HB172150]
MRPPSSPDGRVSADASAVLPEGLHGSRAAIFHILRASGASRPQPDAPLPRPAAPKQAATPREALARGNELRKFFIEDQFEFLSHEVRSAGFQRRPDRLKDR